LYFQYGGYRHPDHEVSLVSSVQQQVEDTRGQLIRKNLTIEGVLTGETQQELRESINALVLAYSAGGRSAGLYHDDGALSAHALDSSAATGGVRVVRIEFPHGDAAEYATQRTYRIELEADFATTTSDLSSWQETLQITGNGGPRFVHIEVQNGPPVKQLVSQSTVSTAIQTGSATGVYSRPTAPPPVWPQAEQLSQRRISPSAPQQHGGRFTSYGIAWEYHFESAAPLTGQPTPR